MKKSIIKKRIALVAAFALLMGGIYTGVDLHSEAKDADADVVLSTVQDLNDFSASVSSGYTYQGKLVILDADIRFEGTAAQSFESIGNKSEYGFAGTFDGRGHTISGLKMIDKGPGLFKTITDKGTVKNVKFSTSSIQNSYIGGIAELNGGTISNCIVMNCTMKATDSQPWLGSITDNNAGTVINCASLGNTLSGADEGGCIGGIVAVNNNGTIANSCNTSDISNKLSANERLNSFGGIAGFVYGGVIENCYNSGKMVDGEKDRKGSIAGDVSNKAVITTCYASLDSAEETIKSVSTDSTVTKCDTLPRADMMGEAFRTKLNSNRSYNADIWSEWTLPSYTMFPIPAFPGSGNVSPVKTPAATATATATTAPTRTPVVTPAPTATPQPTQTPVATATPKPTQPSLYPNPMKVKGKTAKVSERKLMEQSIKLTVDKVLTIKNAVGKLSFVKKFGDEEITINKKNGKVKIGIGLVKGTYSVGVMVTAAGTREFEKKQINAIFKIKVK